MAQTPRKKPDSERIVPVVEERLVVKKARDEQQVRIKKIVRERTEELDEPLVSEEVVVERVPVGRFVDAPVADRYEGDTLVVSVLEEVPVIRLRLKEEIRITKKSTKRRERRAVNLRSESIEVERPKPKRAI